MPKEITHWHISHRTATLSASNAVTESMVHWPATALLGAIAYDSPFYALGFPNREFFAETADTLHGVHGEDTLDRFRRLAHSLDLENPSEPLAFVGGALTHYAADVTIHPFVNYFCNGSPGATGRHRALETAMDLYVSLSRGIPKAATNGMGNMLRQVSMPKLRETATLFYRADGLLNGRMALKLFRQHAFIRDRFQRQPWQMLAGLLAHTGQKGEIVAATFYPSQRKVQAISEDLSTFFETPAAYRHPRTGEHHTMDLNDLLTEASTRAGSLIAAFAEDALPTERGSSLDAGCDVETYPREKFTDFTSDLARFYRFYHR